MTIEIIVAAGDSFTAGDELLGDELIESYTDWNYRSHSDSKNAKRFAELGAMLKTKDREFQKDFLHRSKDCTWANKFAKSVNLPILNIADRGLSNQEIVHRTIRTIIDLEKNGTNLKNVLCLLMITHPLRFGFPCAPKKNEYDFETLHFNLNTISSEKDKDKRNFGKYVLVNSDFYDLFWQSYCALSGLKNYLSYKGIRHEIFDSSLWSWGVKQADWDKLDKRYGLSYDCNNIINPVLRLSDHPINNHKLPGGHFIEEVHDYFAERIKTELFYDL